jgi:hypothetical protein
VLSGFAGKNPVSQKRRNIALREQDKPYGKIKQYYYNMNAKLVVNFASRVFTFLNNRI